MNKTFDVVELTSKGQVPKEELKVLANSEGMLSITYIFDDDDPEKIELGVSNIPALIDMLTTIKHFMDARKEKK